MPAKPKLRLVKPTTQKRAVGPLRRPNSEFRSREHLTETVSVTVPVALPGRDELVDHRCRRSLIKKPDLISERPPRWRSFCLSSKIKKWMHSHINDLIRQSSQALR
jgi:hypothetical protein